MLCEDLQGVPGERYSTCLTVLGLPEGQHLTFEVDICPAKIKQFTTSPPVDKANTTTICRYLLRLWRQASSNRSRSSSERKRTLPRGSFGLLTLWKGLPFSHSHSWTATVKACESTARYRRTVEFS